MDILSAFKTFCFKIYSQSDWRSPERASILTNLIRAEEFGTPEKFEVNQGEAQPISAFKANEIGAGIESGKVKFITTEGVKPISFSSLFALDRIREYKDMLLGNHTFIVHRFLASVNDGPSKLDSWLEVLEKLAVPLDIRYGEISDLTYSGKWYNKHRKWISPQYILSVARVMLFGPREIERFGREILLNAPAYEIREISEGYILLVSSPKALDAHAPEDEEALNRLSEYLLTQPRVEELM